MTLLAAAEAYIVLRRALGAVFSVDARILRSFCRSLGDIPVATISPELCLAFCRGNGPPTRFWLRKHEALRGFFRHLVGREHLEASPLPEPPPRIRSTFQPYIYSHDEIQRLLAATATCLSGRCCMTPLTLRTLVLFIYGAGLRAGEALRLRCCDVDCRDRLVTIWDTKFFKSRLVPVGAALAVALERHRSDRERLPLLDGERSPFFSRHTGEAIPLGRLDAAFVRLREHAGIRRPATERWQPRVHDLRATFAVHRLLAWYRDGEDVQARLPLLATYMGHVNLSGTQTYLRMTPELLSEASLRFERYASPSGARTADD
ncbi:MAG: tyrosine-type recombinase/integrase [Gemmatimonadetes bacterium]|nr:tyrosine-type recombinase/integrase [Gemmatimonadota bacterium]